MRASTIMIDSPAHVIRILCVFNHRRRGSGGRVWFKVLPEAGSVPSSIHHSG